MKGTKSGQFQSKKGNMEREIIKIEQIKAVEQEKIYNSRSRVSRVEQDFDSLTVQCDSLGFV